MSRQLYFKQFSLAYEHSLNVKIVLFQVIRFSVSTQFSSIWPIDRTLSGTTTPDQNGSGNDGNKGVLRIPQNSRITGTSPLDCLVSYPEHSLAKVLTLCRSAVNVVYSHNRLDNDRIAVCHKYLVAKKNSPCEIDRRMYNMYGEAFFSQKNFRNEQNVCLPQRTWVTKTFNGLKTPWLSGKEKIPDAAVSKEHHADSVLRHESTFVKSAILNSASYC